MIYELRIAAGFTRIGLPVHWTAATDAGRRPEFVVNPGFAAPVSVECKKRDVHDGYEKGANRFFEHFQFKLRQRMEAQTLNAAVKLTAEQFRLGDVEGVVKDIVQSLTTQEMGVFKIHDGFLVEFGKLAEPGGSIPDSVFELFPRGVYGLNISSVGREQLRSPGFPGDRGFQGPALNPKIVRMEFVDDPTRRVNGVLRNLKTAAKQVHHGYPSVVYVDVALGSYPRESVEFDSIRGAVAAQLARAHTRVSAVVLTAIEPTVALDNIPIWWMHADLVEQPQAQFPLPQDIFVPGSSGAGQWIPGGWREVWP